VWGDGSAIRSFVYVVDVAAAVIRILDAGSPGRVYNVDSGVPITIAGLAEIVRDAVAPSSEIVFDPSKPSGAPYRVASIEALAGLCFTPATTLEDGIAATVEWYRSSSGMSPQG
jgi:GDP-L-fucose synthase